MITLKIHNDGKEKHQSFEAWVEGIDCEKGYGATREEAIDEYKKELERFWQRVSIARSDLVLGGFEVIKVDWCGKEI
jgi:hypothetical protein